MFLLLNGVFVTFRGRKFNDICVERLIKKMKRGNYLMDFLIIKLYKLSYE